MPPTPVSPKVSAPLWAGVIATVILANISFITPDMLTWLGPWAPFAYGCVFTALGAVVGYNRRDPLRELGAQTANDSAAAALSAANAQFAASQGRHAGPGPVDAPPAVTVAPVPSTPPAGAQ